VQGKRLGQITLERIHFEVLAKAVGS